MKEMKNIFFGVLAVSTLAISFGNGAVQSYASDKSGDASDTTVISKVSETPNWEYPAERGAWPKRLGLSDNQMKQLVSLKSEYAINTAKPQAELKADIKELILLMTEPKLDNQAISALNEKIELLKATLYDARVNQMLNTMNIMTPKQREKVRHHMLVRTLSDHHSSESNSHKSTERQLSEIPIS